LSGGLSHPSVGVHVRRGDFVHSAAGPIVAPLDQYVRAVGKILKRTRAKTLFLATDDDAVQNCLPGPNGEKPQSVYETFAATFGETRIIRQSSPNLNRSEPNAIQDALVDLLCLRQCDVICGQRGSSFTKIASIGKKKVILGGSWFGRVRSKLMRHIL
jgi:hypothetical protein